MHKFSIVLLISMLIITQYTVAQYSGGLNLSIDNPQADITKNSDNSREFVFTVSTELSNSEAEIIREALELTIDLSNLNINNNSWSMHVNSGVDRKTLLTHFINNGFRYITVQGNQQEILTYIASKNH